MIFHDIIENMSHIFLCLLADMNSKRGSIAVVWFLVLAAATSAQAKDSTAYERLHERFQALSRQGLDSPAIIDETWTHLQSGDLTPEETALNQFKLAWAANLWPKELPEEAAEWMEEGCADDLALGVDEICTQIGTYHFHRSDFRKAIAAFQRAEANSNSIELRTRSLENIAVSYVQMAELDEALRYFEIAMKLREGKPNAMTVNNLAGIYNRLNNPTQALTTLELVDWDTEVGPAKRMALINKLTALRSLPDRHDDMVSAYTNLKQQFPVPRYPQEVADVVRTALLLGDTTHVSNMRAEMEAVVHDNGAFAAEWMPDLALLFDLEGHPASEHFQDLPWDLRWALSRWMVRTLQANRKEQMLNQTGQALEADLREALQAVEQSQDRLWMMGVFAGTLSCLLLLILRQRVQVSRLRREVAKSGLVFKPENYQAIQVIRDAITQGKNINTALIHLSNLNDLLTHGIPPKALSDIDNPLLKTLNRRELQLLEQIQRGYSSKEISIILNISPGHVYNMRSIIREKLGLDREMDLEEWLKNLFSESQETMVRERKREKESKEVS